MASRALLSIITIVYNDAYDLEATLASIQRIKNTTVELIVIDGGSDDYTRLVISKFRSLIDFYCSEPDEGIYDAMNKGLSKAQGKWVWFVNAGDEVHRSFEIEKINFSDDVGLICGGVEIFFEQQAVSIKVKEQERGRLSGLSHQSMIIRREIHKNIPYSKKYRMISDVLFRENLLAIADYKIFSFPFSRFGLGGISSVVDSWSKLEQKISEEKIIRPIFIVFFTNLAKLILFKTLTRKYYFKAYLWYRYVVEKLR